MCWLPIGLGLVGGIVGGLATYLAKGWGFGLWSLPFGALCGATVIATVVLFALRAHRRDGTGGPRA